MHPFVKSSLRILGGVLILGVGAAVMNALISMKTEPPVSDRPAALRAVRTVRVDWGQSIPETPVEGRVEALYRMEIISEVTGSLKIGGKEFREGMEFSSGEIMLSMDDSEALSTLVAQRNQFLQVLSQHLADLRIDFPDSWPVWAEFIASIDTKKTLPELPTAGSDREQLFMANRGISSLFHTIRSAEERLSKFRIEAPFDGVVTLANVRPGAVVRAGQVMGVFVGTDAYEIKTAVHARYLSTIRKGDAVNFQDENGTIVATGLVHRIAGHVDPSTQSSSVYCRVRAVEGSDTAVRDGRFLSGVIQSEAISESATVPLNLLNQENELYLIRDEHLHKQQVEVLYQSRTHAIVKGLDSMDVLLNEVLTTAFDAMPVRTEIGESGE